MIKYQLFLFSVFILLALSDTSERDKGKRDDDDYKDRDDKYGFDEHDDSHHENYGRDHRDRDHRDKDHTDREHRDREYWEEDDDHGEHREHRDREHRDRDGEHRDRDGEHRDREHREHRDRDGEHRDREHREHRDREHRYREHRDRDREHRDDHRDDHRGDHYHRGQHKRRSDYGDRNRLRNNQRGYRRDRGIGGYYDGHDEFFHSFDKQRDYFDYGHEGPRGRYPYFEGYGPFNTYPTYSPPATYTTGKEYNTPPQEYTPQYTPPEYTPPQEYTPPPPQYTPPPQEYTPPPQYTPPQYTLPSFTSRQSKPTPSIDDLSIPADCEITCPPFDKGTSPLSASHTGYHNDISCSYSYSEGDEETVFYCNYDSTTGRLLDDHNGGLCLAHVCQEPTPNPCVRGYQCLSKDNGGYYLNTDGVRSDDTTLTCSYPGDHPDNLDYYCVYDITGNLKTASNAPFGTDFCPLKANTCGEVATNS